MKKLRVPILTEEYVVNVYIGTHDELVFSGAKYLNQPTSFMEGILKNVRGRAFNCFPERNPLIVVDGSIPFTISLATVAHEASHAMDYISDYICLEHTEFRGHGIGAIMRAVLKVIKFKK